MKNYIAYVYKWTHLPSMKWYIGSRTNKRAHPDDGYLCSSRIVKPMLIENISEWRREILATGPSKEMRCLEAEILTIFDAKNDGRSFNQHNGDGNFSTIGMVPFNKGQSLPDEQKRKISISRKGQSSKSPTDETRKILRDKKLGKNNPAYGKSPWNKGLIGVYTQTNAANEKRRQALIGKKRPASVGAKVSATKQAKKLQLASKNQLIDKISMVNTLSNQ
jgi:hypothetical protein